MNKRGIVDLCSPDSEVLPVERPQSRRRRSELGQELSSSREDNIVIDLSADSPERRRTTRRSGAEEATKVSRRELTRSRVEKEEIEDPPRWQGRRRTLVRGSRAGQEGSVSAAQASAREPAAESSFPGSWRATSRGAVEGRGRGFKDMADEVPLPPMFLDHPSSSRRDTSLPGASSQAQRSSRRAIQAQEASDAEFARRVQMHADAAMAAAGRSMAAGADEAELARGMHELEALQATGGTMDGEMPPWRLGGMFGRRGGHPLMPAPPPPRGRPFGSGASRARALGGASLADAMLDMLGEEGMMSAGGMGAHVHNRMHLVREAFMSLHTGRLPPHMLLSDRDFDENDYEMLLALDEGVENRKGAKQAAIDKIPTTLVPAKGVSEDDEKRCPICLEEVVPGAVLRQLACKHSFHRHCLDKWLAQKATCPICQRDCR